MITLGFGQRSNAATHVGRPQLRIDHFYELCEQVLEFAKEHAEQCVEVVFAIKGGSTGLYVMTKAEAYDFELSRKLAEFAAPYVAEGILESVTLLPASSPEELEAFFDPKKAIRIEIEHA